MEVILVDPITRLCQEWDRVFAHVDGISIFNGYFESLSGKFDCLVSAANSFGLMDGGVDLAITNFFGPSLQERVQREIWRNYRGEQPVGTCLMVATEDSRCAWLAHCPTMRVPLDVSRTNNAYAAFLVALISAEAAGVSVLACPGLGTLSGKMPPDIAARQMRFAFDMWKQRSFVPSDWRTPVERESGPYGRLPGSASR